MNAASPADVKKAAKRDKEAAEMKHAAALWVMGDPRGRLFVAEILTWCNPLKSPFSPNGSLSNFNMGEQNVGLKLFAKLEQTSPDLFLTMRREILAREDEHNV